MAAVRDDGVLVGSVSGGCIEKQLSEQFRVRDLPQVHTHTIDNDQAKRFGLACGGELQLLFESVSDLDAIAPLLMHVSRRERVKRCVNLSSHQSFVEPAARHETFAWDGNEMVHILGASYRILIVGAGELSLFTARFAMALDFEVIVVDPREHFRKNWSLDGVVLLSDSPDDAVLQYATDAQSAVLALSHDPNIDDLAMMEAVPSDAFYVGAHGSRRTHEKRCQRLAGLDVPVTAIERARGPVGLDIGGRTSAEIAVSIVAELIQVRSRLV